MRTSNWTWKPIASTRSRRAQAFQKHQPVSVEASVRKESRRVEAGTIVVRTAQPLGSLACLSARTAVLRRTDDLELFRCHSEGEQDYPVLRLPARQRLFTAGPCVPCRRTE